MNIIPENLLTELNIIEPVTWNIPFPIQFRPKQMFKKKTVFINIGYLNVLRVCHLTHKKWAKTSVSNQDL